VNTFYAKHLKDGDKKDDYYLILDKSESHAGEYKIVSKNIMLKIDCYQIIAQIYVTGGLFVGTVQDKIATRRAEAEQVLEEQTPELYKLLYQF
jgi:hypothetical protein